ncbi:MAG: substrate-binding domain-containing protein [Clostridia bacterium]|nr:substrate-binding domain-containing protein [Clostridia bacterium]
MRKTITSLLAIVLIFSCVTCLAACGNVEKNITVVVREQGSGTREAFDKVVTDGEHFLEEKDADGKKVYNTTNTAVQQTKTGTVLSTVASDKNAIGYISLGSLNDSVKVVSVDGAVPSEATVLDGTYKIQRPFVVMTNANVTLDPITADFMNYLKSADTKAHAEAAGCIFLEDGTKRANEGSAPIEVVAYTKQASLPTGGKIVVRGSTSMEKFINAAAKAYSDLYGVNAEEIFDIQLEGSSVGRKAVEDDTKGNVIGLSSASVNQADITSFNACLDAVVVVVHKDNANISNLTLKNLYDIFSGKVIKFSAIADGTVIGE